MASSEPLSSLKVGPQVRIRLPPAVSQQRTASGALIAVQRGAETEKPAATALFGQLSQQIDAFSGEVLAGVAMVVDAPRLFGWARPSHELRIADGEHAVLPLPLSGDKLVAGFPFGAKDVERVVKLRTIEFRFAADSPLEEAGFEPSVPRLG